MDGLCWSVGVLECVWCEWYGASKWMAREGKEIRSAGANASLAGLGAVLANILGPQCRGAERCVQRKETGVADGGRWQPLGATGSQPEPLNTRSIVDRGAAHMAF